MNTKDKVAVCSRSFSANLILRNELLKKYSQVIFNESGNQLCGEELVSFLENTDKAIIGLESVDDNLLMQLPKLKVIGKYGVGLDKLDLVAIRRRGIRLGATSGTNSRSVAELTLAFMIMMLRHVPQCNLELRVKNWKQKVGRTLTGKVVGIVGCGHVGKDLISLLKSFNCKILINDIAPLDDYCNINQLQAVNLNQLLKDSDVVTLHIPLDETTRNLINEEEIRLMRPSSILINTARGGVVNELALKKALIDNKIAGAAFDVFEVEPPIDIELINLKNFYSTPHIGGSAAEAILSMGIAAIEGLDINTIP